MASLPSRSTLLRRSLLGGAAVVVAAGAAFGLGAVAAGTEVEVLAAGELHEVRLRDGTVADALLAAEVALRPQDVVTPSEDTVLDDSL